MWYLSRTGLGAAWIALLMWPMFAGATDRPILGVDFRLVDSHYTDDFTAAEVADIEKQSEANIAKMLNRRYRFLEFEPEAGQTYRVIVTLGMPPNDLTVEVPRDIQFGVRSASRAATSQNRIHWPFREIQDYLRAAGDMEAFVNEITAQFGKAVDENSSVFVRQVLSKIPLVEQAYLLIEESSWVLPFSREELRVERESEFAILVEMEIQHSIEEPIYTVKMVGHILPSHPVVPVSYHNKMKTVIIDGDARRLSQASQVETKGVFIVHYVPLEMQSTSPSQLSDID